MYTARTTMEKVCVFMGVFSWAWFCGSMFFFVGQVCVYANHHKTDFVFFRCSNVLHVMMWIVAIRRLEVSTSSLRRYVSPGVYGAHVRYLGSCRCCSHCGSGLSGAHASNCAFGKLVLKIIFKQGICIYLY